jgi:phosphoglycolate phosphatase-like HAD superfamily hydrolase
MSAIELTKYQTIIFDCDGVILNSNKIKTEAFYNVAKVYGHNSAVLLRDYHINNGGISRYEKFEYLFTDIMNKPIETQEMNKLISQFSREIKTALLVCEVTQKIKELRYKTRESTWMIVSGGDQGELREVFEKRALSTFFDGGIFGSPENKSQILQREKNKGNIVGNILFIGDSRYDFEVSKAIGADFIFLYAWTDFYQWKNYFKDENIKIFKVLSELLS